MRMREAFGDSCRPAPTSVSASARSMMSTSKPRRARHKAAASPPIPAPMIATARDIVACQAALWAKRQPGGLVSVAFSFGL